MELTIAWPFSGDLAVTTTEKLLPIPHELASESDSHALSCDGVIAREKRCLGFMGGNERTHGQEVC